jgi:phosphomannomutase
MKGIDGAAEIKSLMEKLRKNPPKSIGGMEVLTVTDIKSGEIFDMKTNKNAGRVDLPSSNVIVFKMGNKARVIARPSGTEPKIKFYFSTYGKALAGETVKKLMTRVDGEHSILKNTFIKELGL